VLHFPSKFWFAAPGHFRGDVERLWTPVNGMFAARRARECVGSDGCRRPGAGGREREDFIQLERATVLRDVPTVWRLEGEGELYRGTSRR
jgi:hypothetical protein